MTPQEEKQLFARVNDQLEAWRKKREVQKQGKKGWHKGQRLKKLAASEGQPSGQEPKSWNQSPTGKQLLYLMRLGYTGPKPATKKEAKELIVGLLGKRKSQKRIDES
jgi:hypothetical protein